MSQIKTTAAPSDRVFERETCGRCSGTGRYSYNQMHGSVCYGCNGKGERLTKRGAAAASFYKSLANTTADQINAGDRVKYTVFALNGMSSATGFFRVLKAEHGVPGAAVSIDPSTGKYVRKPVTRLYLAHSKAGEHVFELSGDRMIERAPANEEQRAAWLQSAAAYQATLTKAGKPRAK